MKRVIKWVVGLVLAALFVGTFVFLYRKSQPAEVRYVTHAVRRTTLERTTVLTGTVEPRDEVLIKPQISGIISEVLCKAGDRVKQGDVIATVKVIPEMGTLNAAESRVTVARLSLDQTRKEFERTEASMPKAWYRRRSSRRGRPPCARPKRSSRMPKTTWKSSKPVLPTDTKI